MRRFLIIGILLLLPCLIISPVLVLHFVSADSALVASSTTIDSRTAARIKRIVRQIEYASYFNRTWTLVITQQDLNGILAMGARAVKRIKATGSISGAHGTILNFSLHSPENPFGQFINITVITAPDSDGITIRQLKIGQLSLHDRVAQSIIESAIAYLLGEQHSADVLNAVKTISTRNNKLIIQYQPLPNLGKIVAHGLNQSGLIGGDLKAFATPAAIRFHYQELCQQFDAKKTRALTHYLADRFSDAALRSNTLEQAITENRAALTALAIFFGSYKFNTIINAIPANEIKRCQRRASKPHLAGRKDLSLHFIYSAMIKLMSDSNISWTVGEFKELSDAFRGGSGFSFTDLAADQAGIQFATFATQPSTARELHKRTELLEDESNFFPSVADLSEGISQQQFEQDYGGIEGETYLTLVDDINTRIHQLPLYKNIH